MSQLLSTNKPTDEIPNYPIIQKIKKAAGSFIHFALALLITFVIVRISELILISVSNDFPREYSKITSAVIIYDFLFFFKFLPFLFIPFLLVYFINNNRNVNFWTFGILASVLILIYTLLIQYFGTALVPLGSDLYGYSLEEIGETISGNSEFGLVPILLLIIPLLSFWPLLYFFHSKTFIKSIYAYVILGTGILLAYFGISTLPSYAGFTSDFAYNISINKAAFFTKQTTSYFDEDDAEAVSEIGQTVSEKALDGKKSFNYLNPEYPFLRSEDTHDVLGNFFNIDSLNRPNIVFIQVEGLGRAFSGKNAYLRSFTPYLDQLANKGLYWENFLATQGRTFASLASVLGSLPFADKGYNDLGDNMPKHYSLLNILNKNGYTSSYYAGFEMQFDNMGLYMKNSGVDQIVSAVDFGKEFTEASSWGYSDKDLMKKFFYHEAVKSSQPFVSYIETMSMHTPYIVPNQAAYTTMFNSRMEELGFNNTKRESYNQYKDIYSSILYTDQSIRYFFDEYAKLPSFKNTIFIITGDHRLPEIPMSSKIDRYHVPLIIYSPMLKRRASFKSVSSHLDITPSLLAFLRANYAVKTPKEVAWVGSGLDTARVLRNIHKYPLKQSRSSLHNYISGLNFIDQEQLFTVSDNMHVTPVENEKVFKRLQREFAYYKMQNSKFNRELQLIPDSLYTQFMAK